MILAACWEVILKVPSMALRNPQRPRFFCSVRTATTPATNVSSSETLMESRLDRCSSLLELKKVHAVLVVSGRMQTGALLVGKLVSLCAVAGGGVGHARAIFERIPPRMRNRFSWNSLIRAYSLEDSSREALFLHRRMVAEDGILPNEFTFPFVLKACAAECALTETILVHALIAKLGFGAQVFVQNSLLNAYSACSRLLLARDLFDEMFVRNIVSWNTMIGGYVKAGDCVCAFAMFREMRQRRLAADVFTLVSLLSISSRKGSLGGCRVVHHHIVVHGTGVDVITENALVDTYAKCGDLRSARLAFYSMPERNVVTWTTIISALAEEGEIEYARSLFDEMPSRNVVTWNAMISGYLCWGLCREALELYKRMQSSDVEADETTLAAVLSACGQLGDLITGEEVHCSIPRQTMSTTLYNGLMDMYAKCGVVDKALALFDTMPTRDLVSWNVIIGAMAVHGRAMAALDYFKTMTDEGFTPDKFTFLAALSACSHGGLWEQGRQIFEAMEGEFRVKPEVEHYACMVDVFGKAGKIKEAAEMISAMPVRPDVVVWGTFLGACRARGEMKAAKQALKQLLELELGRGGPFVLMSNALAEASMIEEAGKIRKLMEERGTRKERGISSVQIDARVHEFILTNNISGQNPI